MSGARVKNEDNTWCSRSLVKESKLMVFKLASVKLNPMILYLLFKLVAILTLKFL